MARTALLALSLVALAGGVTPLHAGGVTVGEAVTVTEVTPIADILASPRDYAGRVVRVEGKVSGVCAMAGCWMELEDEARRRLRIKVEDGVLVFPKDATGRQAVAQGTVGVQALSREQYVAWRQHLAEEMGTTFDEATVGGGPFELVQIAGSGATIGD